MENGRNVRMLVMLTLILLAGAIFTPSQKAAAVTGPITGDVTWSGTVTLTGDIIVKETGNLTILPGTVVKSMPNVDDQVGGINTSHIEIIVEAKGTLIAEGSSASPILFTSSRTEPKQKGDWYGLRIQSDNVSFRYCTVEYGKTGLTIEGGLPPVDYCTFQKSEVAGVDFQISGTLSQCTLTENNYGISSWVEWGGGDGIAITLNSCSISNNVGDGIRFGRNGRAIVTDTTIVGNGGNGIYAQGGGSVSDSVISNNGGYGFTAANWGGDLTLTYSTVSSNGGTGIGMFYTLSLITINNSSITNNYGSGIGDIYYGNSVGVRINNSLISSNVGSGITGSFYQGVVVASSSINNNGMDGINKEWGNFYNPSQSILTVTDSTVSNNGARGIAFDQLSPQGLTGNCIQSNQVGIEVNSVEPVMQLTGGNDIFNNKDYELKNSGNAAVIADNEYWGEPTTTELLNGVDNLTKIYDSKDSPNIGQIVIHTWRDAPQYCKESPAADFDVDLRSGPAPLTVHYADKSIGSITSWLWDFGDSEISGEQNPMHTYANSGKYTVKLTVTGPGGSDSETKVAYITVINCDQNGDGKVNKKDIMSVFKTCKENGGDTKTCKGEAKAFIDECL